MTPELQRQVHAHAASAAQRARDRDHPVLLSVSLPAVSFADPLALLETGPPIDEQGFFWQQPAERFAIAGSGAAAVCTGHGSGRFTEVAASRDLLLRGAVCVSLEPDLSEAGPRFVGGFAFAPHTDVEGPWQGFPPGRLVLPRIQVTQRGTMAVLTCNAMVDASAVPDEIARRLVDDLARTRAAVAAQGNGGSAKTLTGWDDTPATRYEAAATEPLPQWRAAVAETVADIRRGRLRKLVLARGCTVRSERPFGCARLVRRLRQGYPECTTFWIRTPHGDFVGATPEVLASLHDGVVRTAAVAGSIARGTSAEVDRVLAHLLLSSSKEREEHGIVVRAIEQALRPLCSTLEVAAEPQLLDLDNVRHLITPIRGRLTTRRDLLELVEHLHPTPAVAGHPCGAALEALHQRERFNRGWYAGPVGWTDDQGEGEFVVALRSALVRGTDAFLYAGAGIVAGSDPDAEICETRLKLQPMLSALLEL